MKQRGGGTYSRNFATDGTFTNILGMLFTGHQAFLDRHEEIFKGMFRGTGARQNIVSVKFVRADVVVVETLTWISGFSRSGPPPGAHTEAKGRLCTRLLQVLVRDGGKWSIASCHNADLKARHARTRTKMKITDRWGKKQWNIA
jgi:uncharacterized protein (TIGR02246 family)